MTSRELIELLLLRSRGVIDEAMVRLADYSVVQSICAEIIRLGYLRSLDQIPALQSYPGPFARYIFSAAGRIRFYHLERLFAESSADGPRDNSGSHSAE